MTKSTIRPIIPINLTFWPQTHITDIIGGHGPNVQLARISQRANKISEHLTISAFVNDRPFKEPYNPYRYLLKLVHCIRMDFIRLFQCKTHTLYPRRNVLYLEHVNQLKTFITALRSDAVASRFPEGANDITASLLEWAGSHEITCKKITSKIDIFQLKAHIVPSKRKTSYPSFFKTKYPYFSYSTVRW